MSVAFEFATNNFDCTSNTTCKSQFFINQNCTKEINTKIKTHTFKKEIQIRKKKNYT